jgi:L-fuculose-phosphate aldolase
MIEEMIRFGRDLFLAGLVTSHGGNMSLRLDDKIIISRRGAMLGHLTSKDFVETLLDAEAPQHPLASRELVVHRAIYLNSSVQAILHAHPPYAVVISYSSDIIKPIDSEGQHLLPVTPVVAATETVGSKEVAASLACLAHMHKIIVVRGHGTFAVGKNMEEALQWTSVLEASCKIMYLVENRRHRGLTEGKMPQKKTFAQGMTAGQ